MVFDVHLKVGESTGEQIILLRTPLPPSSLPEVRTPTPHTTLKSSGPFRKGCWHDESKQLQAVIEHFSKQKSAGGNPGLITVH